MAIDRKRPGKPSAGVEAPDPALQRAARAPIAGDAAAASPTAEPDSARAGRAAAWLPASLSAWLPVWFPFGAQSARRLTALVPESSISGRALVIVVVIMTFLAGMTAGAVELIAAASQSWSADVTREMTIQVRPRSGRDLDADVRLAEETARSEAGLRSVRAYTKAQSEALLEPWLGTALPFDQMPVPRMIVLAREPAGPAPDLGRLRRRLAEAVPTATLDDHRQWSSRLVTMANALVLVGLFVMILVLAATGLAIAFATRGAMAGTREIVNVLHLVGAEDRFIAAEFQRHFLLMGLRGGLIGGGLAIGAFLLAGALSSRWNATPEGDQIEALFGAFSLGWRGYAAVVCIALVVAGLTAVVTRLTVYRNLRNIS